MGETRSRGFAFRRDQRDMACARLIAASISAALALAQHVPRVAALEGRIEMARERQCRDPMRIGPEPEGELSPIAPGRARWPSMVTWAAVRSTSRALVAAGPGAGPCKVWMFENIAL